jgi:hypothetical protein
MRIMGAGRTLDGLGMKNRLVIIDECAGAIRTSGRTTAHSETMLSGYFAGLGMKNANTEIGQTDPLPRRGIGGIGARISLPLLRRLPSREAGHRE